MGFRTTRSCGINFEKCLLTLPKICHHCYTLVATQLEFSVHVFKYGAGCVSAGVYVHTCEGVCAHDCGGQSHPQMLFLRSHHVVC